MNTNVKNITIEFVCNNCLRKKTIYLCVIMDIHDLIKHIMDRKCLTCDKGSLDISHVDFSYDSGDPLVGEK